MLAQKLLTPGKLFKLHCFQIEQLSKDDEERIVLNVIHSTSLPRLVDLVRQYRAVQRST